jgi:hypothetical protein
MGMTVYWICVGVMVLVLAAVLGFSLVDRDREPF